MRRPRPWHLLVALLLILLIVEAAVRLRQYSRYGTTKTSYYDRALDPATGLLLPIPGQRVGPIEINSLRFRGPEIERPKPPGRIRVAFVGASTTFCVEASSREATWPHLVVEGLEAAAPDLDFDYVNGGVAAFTVEASLVNLERRIAPLEPDVIVYYEATNDFTVDSRLIAAEAGLYEPGQTDSWKIGEWWLTWYLVEKNLRQYLATRPSAGRILAYDPVQLSRPFQARLTRLLESAQALSPVVAIATFGIRMRAEQTPEEQRAAAASALYHMPFLDVPGLIAGYDEYNRVIREVAKAKGAILIEGEETIPGDALHFADSVHFRDPGQVLQAKRILGGLLAAPAYRELLVRHRSGSGG